VARKKHKDKEIEQALQHAESCGWIVEVHNKSKSHAWGIMKCPFNNENCWNGIYCFTSIWSTPRNAHNHAQQIKKVVNKCQYKEGKEDE